MCNRITRSSGIVALAGILVLAGCASGNKDHVRTSRDGTPDNGRAVRTNTSEPEYTGAATLPPAARNAIEKSEPGCLICDVDPAGGSGYSVVVWIDGRVRELMVRSDGLVLTNFGEYTEMQDLQRLPESVVRAAKEAFPKGKMYRADMPSGAGDTIYVIYFLDGGKQHVVEVNHEGDTLNRRAL